MQWPGYWSEQLYPFGLIMVLLIFQLDLSSSLQAYAPHSGGRPGTSRPEPRVSFSVPLDSHRPPSSQPAESPVLQSVTEEVYRPVTEYARQVEPQETSRASTPSQPFPEDPIASRMPEYSFTDLLGLSAHGAIPQSQFASSSAPVEQQTPSSTEFFFSLGFTPDPGTGGA